MKFTPEVIAALETLRKNAENDFERHRLDVLEKDLTNPPKVEIIDGNHQNFNGTTYFVDKKGHYSTHKFIHKDVWEYFKGELPEGYVIHHNDFNPANNNISNLIPKTSSEHSRLHILHHKPHLNRNKKITAVCEWCGKEFKRLFVGNNRFCSHSCCNAYSKNKNKEERTCIICGKKFLVPKQSKRKTCSFACRGELSKRTWELKKDDTRNKRSVVAVDTSADNS